MVYSMADLAPYDAAHVCSERNLKNEIAHIGDHRQLMFDILVSCLAPPANKLGFYCFED